MRRTIILTGLLFVLSAVNATAFDGKRKGFVIGGGLGFAPVGHWETDNATPKVDESEAGGAANLLLGYSWDESNMLVFEANGVTYKSDVFSSIGNLIGAGDQTVTQGYAGPAWYHYYGAMGGSVFSVVGLGLYTFDVEDADPNDAGFGFMGGFGYEFSPHWQAALYLAAGNTSVGLLDFKHSHLSVVINAVAF